LVRKVAYAFSAYPGGAVSASQTDLVDVFKHDGDTSLEADIDTDLEGLWSFTYAPTGSAATSWVLDAGPIFWTATLSTRTRRGSSKSGGAVGPNSLLELPILFGAWTGSADDGAVIAGQLNTLAVAAVAANVKVTVDTGYANLDGQLVYNGASRTINLAAANATNPRIDRIILERTRTAGDTEGKIVLKVSTGTPAASPAAPALTNDANTLQYSLAQVRVNALSTSVTSVTDERTYALTSVSRNPTLETTARETGSTALTTTGASVANLAHSPTLVNGVMYDCIIEADVFVDGASSVGMIAPFLNGTSNASDYQSAPAQSGTVTLTNAHSASILGTGASISCGVLAKRSGTANTVTLASGVSRLTCIPRS
jgi:hypothetical protein